MADSYILDACALIGYFGDKVRELFRDAYARKNRLFMHNLNVLEIYYGVRRAYSESVAARILRNIQNLPITFISEIGGASFIEAGRLKSSHKMSLADAVLLGEASTRNAVVVTSDHHELDAVEAAEPIQFFWIR
jgi:predicted nucleic acid-binding protein